MLSINFNANELKPLIGTIVSEVMEQLQSDDEMLNHRLAFSEDEAAKLLAMKPHQLRDERYRGRIGASHVVKDGIRYTREDLRQYLALRRYQPRPLPDNF